MIRFIRGPRLATTSRFGKLMGSHGNIWDGTWRKSTWDGLFLMLGKHAYILAWREFAEPTDKILYRPSMDFRMVYQGGHHQVYCDGFVHLYASGGFCGITRVRYKSSGKCNCWRYN